MIRAVAFVGTLLLAVSLAHGAPAADAVDHIVIPVSRLDRAVAFYTGALSFVAGEPEASSRLVLHLGKEKIELMQRAGRPIPADSCSNDLWFQHLAIVVSDIDKAYAVVLRAGALPISKRPQLLPAWNRDASGIRGAYFRDPDGHPLELIQFPPDKGEPRWQEKDRLFLGIDHSAIAASDTDQSVAFYRDRLGLRIAGTSDNWGVEQQRLSAVPGAHLRITTLRASSGPGVELLQYLMPTDGRPMPVDTTADDLWAEEIVLRTALAAHFGEWLRDPDGHAVGLVADREEGSR
jgi:catechol 2,3-dioxygenase-like lactoylglutathione lyase family enzyme